MPAYPGFVLSGSSALRMPGACPRGAHADLDVDNAESAR
jgi:hypothetical protein